MNPSAHERQLPSFPKTFHIPWKPNLQGSDVVAESDADLFSGASVSIEEKVDGASVGITFIDGHPVVRNRDHILSKGFLRKKNDTTAKVQFRSIWNYVYEHKDRFKGLEERSVYGEWMVAQHGIYYDRLPEWFIAYDIFDWRTERFLDPSLSRAMLIECGFTVPPQHHYGPLDMSYEELEKLANKTGSQFSTDALAEGIYLKVGDGEWISSRYKMVRSNFVQGALWSVDKLQKNRLGHG